MKAAPLVTLNYIYKMDTKFLSRHEAETITRDFNNGFLRPSLERKNIALISIVSPDDEEGETSTPSLDGFWYKVLYLRFHDIDPTHCSDEWVARYTPFNETHILQIKEFLNSVENDVDGIWVHCEAGVSRSAAVAKYIDLKYDCKVFPESYSLYNKFIYGKLHHDYHDVFQLRN
jgi:hypothetical protein